MGVPSSQRRFVAPRPWSTSFYGHMDKGMLAVVDAEGGTICVIDEDTALFMCSLENKNYSAFVNRQIIGEIAMSKRPAFSFRGNMFEVCRYRQRKRRICDIKRQPKP